MTFSEFVDIKPTHIFINEKYMRILRYNRNRNHIYVLDRSNNPCKYKQIPSETFYEKFSKDISLKAET